MGRTKYLLTRAQYKKIKKMDHQQVSDYLETFYKEAYLHGKKSAEGLSEPQLKEVLLSVKGIGERKAEAIISAVKEAVERKNQGDRETKGEDADVGKEK